MNENIGVSSDWGGEVSVDRRGETVMRELRSWDRARTEVLGGKHTTCRHDSNESVERGERGILRNCKLWVRSRRKVADRMTRETYDTFIERSGESTGSRNVESHIPSFLQNILENLKVRLWWRSVTTVGIIHTSSQSDHYLVRGYRRKQ